MFRQTEPPLSKLSDTQLIILAHASQSLDGNILPLPGSLRGGAQTKVVGSMLKRGLIEERVIDRIQPPDASLNRVWRQDDDGRAILLYITQAGLAAINCAPEDAPKGLPTATEDATEAPKGKGGRKGAAGRKGARKTPGAKDEAKAAPMPRAGTKQEKLIAMLRDPDGASMDDIVAATGWQPHTVRGAIAGALKKELGLEVTSEKEERRGRIYRLPPA